MSQDLVPKPASQVSAVRVLRALLPALLVGAGLLDLLLFHFGSLGLLLLALGGAWFLIGKARAKLAEIEAGSAGQNLSPEENARKLLKRRLMKLQGVDGCEALAERATEQFAQADERLKSFDRLLRSKLEPTELTFTRYRSAAEQVFLSIMDRLNEASEVLTSIESIRPSEVRAEIRSDNANAATLQDRLAVAAKQQIKAETLLNANEQALTEMDRANAALTEMKTKAGLANLELADALKQLEELASRAKRYSI